MVPSRCGHGGPRQHAQVVEVEAASSLVARFHRQRFGPAAGQHVDEDALDALFMEPGVLAERDQVEEQRGTVEARAAVGEGYTGPVRLAGDRDVGFEQDSAQGFRSEAPRSDIQSITRTSYAGSVLKHKITHIMQ